FGMRQREQERDDDKRSSVELARLELLPSRRRQPAEQKAAPKEFLNHRHQQHESRQSQRDEGPAHGRLGDALKWIEGRPRRSKPRGQSCRDLRFEIKPAEADPQCDTDKPHDYSRKDITMRSKQMGV